MRIKYECSLCGFTSYNRDDVELCELRHMGLKTLDEKNEYDKLKQIAKECGSVVYYTNNDTTRKAYDEAINDLVIFETNHNLL